MENNRTQLRPVYTLCIIILFIISNIPTLSEYSPAEHNIWISYIAGCIWTIPLYFIYVRLCILNPGKNLYQIITDMFGKIGGGVICFLYIIYALNVSALTFRNNSEYIKVISLTLTPQIVILFFMLLLAAYIVYKGIVTIGKFSALFLPFMLLLLVFFVVFSISAYNYANIEPVFIEDIGRIATSSFHILCFPFGELIIFFGCFDNVKKMKSKGYYKLFLTAFIVSAVTLIMIILNNLFVLGAPTISKLYFPTYSAISVRNFSFVSNLEIFSTVIFFIAGIVKGCICIYAAVKGFKHLFLKKENQKKFILPLIIGILCLMTCIDAATIVGSTMQMFEFLNIYVWYAPIFQMFPVIMWIISEIKNKKNKKQKAV